MKYTYVPGAVKLVVYPEYKQAPLTGGGKQTRGSSDKKGEMSSMYAYDRYMIQQAIQSNNYILSKEELTEEDIAQLNKNNTLINSEKTLSDVFTKGLEIVSNNKQNIVVGNDGTPLVDENNNFISLSGLFDQAARDPNTNPIEVTKLIASSAYQKQYKPYYEYFISDITSNAGYKEIEEHLAVGQQVAIGDKTFIVTERNKNNIANIKAMFELYSEGQTGGDVKLSLYNDYAKFGNGKNQATIDKNGKYIDGQKFKMRYEESKNVKDYSVSFDYGKNEIIFRYNPDNANYKNRKEEEVKKSINQDAVANGILLSAKDRNNNTVYFIPYTVDDFKISTLMKGADVTSTIEQEYQNTMVSDGSSENDKDIKANPWQSYSDSGESVQIIESISSDPEKTEVGYLDKDKTIPVNLYQASLLIDEKFKKEYLEVINESIKTNTPIKNMKPSYRAMLQLITIFRSNGDKTPLPQLIEKIYEMAKSNISVSKSNQLMNISQVVQKKIFASGAVEAIINKQYNTLTAGMPYINNGKMFTVPQGTIVELGDAYSQITLKGRDEEPASYTVAMVKYKMSNDAYKDFLSNNKGLSFTLTDTRKQLIDDNGNLTKEGKNYFEMSENSDENTVTLSIPVVTDVMALSHMAFTNEVGNYIGKK
mgnify:CR=1 FL=1